MAQVVASTSTSKVVAMNRINIYICGIVRINIYININNYNYNYTLLIL